MTAAKIGSAFAGPWAAFAVSAVLLAVDVNDGVTAGKHALMQGAVGFASGMTGGLGGLAVNVAASGIDYESDGSIGWDNDKFREGAIRSVASYALSAALGGALDAKNSTLGAGLSSGLSSGLMNGVQITSTGWGDLDLDYDKANWREHLVVGAAAGISAMINKKLSGKGNTGSERSQEGNANGTSSYPEQWGNTDTGWNNAFSQKVITGGINSMLMTAAYHAMDGKGFKNDYSQMNWSNMTFSAYDLGNFLGSQTNTWVKERQGYDKKTNKYDETKRNSSGWGEDALALMLEYSDAGEKALKGFFEDIGKGAVKLAGDFVESTANVISGYGFNSDETITQIAAAKGMTPQQYKDWIDYTDEQEDRDVMVSETKKIQVRDEFELAVKDNEKILEKYNQKKNDTIRVINAHKNSVMDLFGRSDSMALEEYVSYLTQRGNNNKESGLYIELKMSLEAIKDADPKKFESEYKRFLNSKDAKKYGANEAGFLESTRKSACVAASLYIELKRAKSNVEGSFSEFFENNVKNGNFRLDSAIMKGYQDVVGQYSVDGNKLIYNRIDNIEQFLNSGKSGVIRFDGGHGEHSANVYTDSSGKMRIVDVSYRDCHSQIEKWVKAKNFKFGFYLGY